jgi:hypothetical protein
VDQDQGVVVGGDGRQVVLGIAGHGRDVAGSLFGPLGLAHAHTLAAFTADELAISLRVLSEVSAGSTGVVVGMAGVREPLLGSTGVVVVLGPIPGLRTTTTSVERSGASLTSLITTTTAVQKPEMRR